MDLIDNLNVLRERFPRLWQFYKDNKKPVNKLDISIETSKSNLPTLCINIDNNKYYIHSKYDPKKEALAIADKYTNDIADKHIFFFGIGLGYHITEIVKRFPNNSYSIYEPEYAMFLKCIENARLEEVVTKKMENIYINTFDAKFVESISKNVIFIPLPSYERVFEGKYANFAKLFVQMLKNKKQNLNVNNAFKKQWINNSLRNFETTLSTPNIMHVNKEVFCGKPVIIAAAGPSLSEDMEYLKKIKERGLAYIFSVGTAINAFLENNLMPDAICTYDPTVLNQKVFKKLVESGITSIPFIYGTSVDFGTLHLINAPKLHMITNQDTVSKFYLKRKDNLQNEMVFDSPTISAIALQLLHKLECNPIIFAGQNLGFKAGELYAEGALVTNQSNQQNKIIIKDVEGNDMYTTEAYNRMRQQLEMYINSYKDREFINTTKGGACISGTKFITIEELFENRLKEVVVKKEWHKKTQNVYDYEEIINASRIMDESIAKIDDSLFRIKEIFRKIDSIKSAALIKNRKIYDKIFVDFDARFKAFLDNNYIQTYIKPMNRVIFEIVQKEISSIRTETDVKKKAEKVINTFGKFIFECEKDIFNILPYVKYMHLKFQDDDFINNLIDKTN